MPLSLGFAFMLGLVSTLHCWGMCGGIITALSIGVPRETAVTPWRRRLLIFTYNGGRILSYGFAGAIAGTAGGFLIQGRSGTYGYFVLQSLAGFVLVLVGAHLAGWLPGYRVIENLGWRIWRVIQPVGRLFVPVDHPAKALLLGMIWGWLPCGLVYSVLLWAGAQANPIAGAATLLCFGAGTLPGMTVAGLSAGAAGRHLQKPWVRRAAGSFVIIVGVLLPVITWHLHLAAGGHFHHG